MPWWKCFECMNHRDVDDVCILDFSHNLLHDVPPDVFQFERTLEELHLNANRIADLPRQLFYCQELKVLNLNDNELTALPPAISSLTNLQRLSLSKNALSTVVDTIKGCKQLVFMDLSLNSLMKLPDPVTSLIAMQELYLNDTSLDFLPANFGRLVNLKILELRDNNLSTLPKSMARLVNLTRIDIGNNEFTELPEVIGQLTNLTELWVDTNRIRRVSATIGNLTKLVHFEASNNLLTHLPNEVANWTQLQELSLSVNDFKQLPAALGQMKSLVALKVDENNLQELPDTIWQLENLEEIMVSHNDLFRLPPSIGQLRKLRFFTADENLLRSLPNELCSCISLSLLSVRGNKLSEVPPDIGHLVNLRVINIVNNFITHLPVSMLNLQQLSALWISDNQSQPLMPLQKEYGPEQSVHLTCFMLPQTTANKLQNAQEKERTESLRHLTAKQMASIDESAAMISPSSHKRRICFASDPVSVTADAAARLMRSPTPYPKELRVLARYARYIQANGQTEYVQVEGLQNGELDANGVEIKEARVTSNAPMAGPNHDDENMRQLHALVGGQPPVQQQQSQEDDEDDVEARCYDELSRFAEQQPHQPLMTALQHRPHLHPNLQPTLSPLLGEDEMDARAAYFYATAEQKITTPVPQIIDYENVSLCSSSVNPATLGRFPAMGPQPIYGSTHERPMSEVRMSQTSSFGDGSLSSAMGVNGMNAMNVDAMQNRQFYSNGTGGTRSPAMLPNPNQYYPYIEQNPDMAQMEGNYPMQHLNNHNGIPNHLSNGVTEEVYYAQSHASESNYSQAHWNNPAHSNNADRISMTSDYARSEQSSVNNISSSNRQPPPYHIARAFTKKSKSDLQHYDHYRNQNGSINGDVTDGDTSNHMTNGHNGDSHAETDLLHQYHNGHTGIPPVILEQPESQEIYTTHDNFNQPQRVTSPRIAEMQQQQQNETTNGTSARASPILQSPNGVDSNLNPDSDSPASSVQSQPRTGKSPWVFGYHKNPKVMQLSVPKTLDVGFTLTQPANGSPGILVGDIDAGSVVNTLLRRNDKILDMDGVDFTRISLPDALTVLSNAGPVINIMISRI